MIWLKLLRVGARLSQAEISKRTGITQQYYSAIELGKCNPPPPTAKRIAAVLGFTWTRFYDEPELSAESGGESQCV